MFAARRVPRGIPMAKEVYAFDTGTSTASGLAWTLIPGMTAIAQGSGLGGRQGLRITPIQFEARVFIIANSGTVIGGAVFPGSALRIIFFQCNYVGPLIADVVNIPSVITNYNAAFVGQDARVRILSDEVLISSVGAQIHHSRHYKIDAPQLLVKNMRYTDAAGTDAAKGGIYCLVLTNATAGVPTVTINTRLHYTDV
jgi:hypothetical protein